jgi:hypothetical protein
MEAGRDEGRWLEVGQGAGRVENGAEAGGYLTAMALADVSAILGDVIAPDTLFTLRDGLRGGQSRNAVTDPPRSPCGSKNRYMLHTAVARKSNGAPQISQSEDWIICAWRRVCHGIHIENFQRNRHTFPQFPEFSSRLFYTSCECSYPTNIYCLLSFRGVKLLFDLYKKSQFFCVTRLPKLHVKGPILSTVSRVCRKRQLTVLLRGWVDNGAER